ncbi:hypothetical protein C8R43DRAFT_1133312 [Mycena crocata]|nr:hypothetical protein C8R43DRAFT_1133312 [Mycena crocata]
MLVENSPNARPFLSLLRHQTIETRSPQRMQQSTPLHTTIDTGELRKTTSAWTGVRLPKPLARLYSLQELQDMGLRYIAWDGWRVLARPLLRFSYTPFLVRSCRPLIDAKNRVFALLGGRPHRDHHGYDSYHAAITEATRLFDIYSSDATGDGRRGDFVAVSVGKSFGGDKSARGIYAIQEERQDHKRNVGQLGVQRIAGFTNGLFRTFAPALHAFYAQEMTLLHIAAPYLRRIFAEALCVFAACTFNFGPSTVTLPHVDAANLAWGWCCITALGNFNPDLGGHLNPVGPQPRHSIPSRLDNNDPLSAFTTLERLRPTRRDPILVYAVTTAGGLFRWVYNGHCSDKDFNARASSLQLKEREADRAVRWEKRHAYVHGMGREEGGVHTVY